jgi:hypothetical protein
MSFGGDVKARVGKGIRTDKSKVIIRVTPSTGLNRPAGPFLLVLWINLLGPIIVFVVFIFDIMPSQRYWDLIVNLAEGVKVPLPLFYAGHLIPAFPLVNGFYLDWLAGKDPIDSGLESRRWPLSLEFCRWGKWHSWTVRNQKAETSTSPTTAWHNRCTVSTLKKRMERVPAENMPAKVQDNRIVENFSTDVLLC